jgi:CBS domain-containing protein
MQMMDSQSKRFTLGGDEAMPVIDAADFVLDLGVFDEEGENEKGDGSGNVHGSLITPENHDRRRDSRNQSAASPASTDSTMLMTNSIQSVATGFARIGKDPIEGNVVISWLNPAHHNDVVNLEAVMNQGAYCVPEYFPVSKAYRLFAKLGLRWIVVIGGDTGGEVTGMLTRKNLLDSHIYTETGIDMSNYQ